MNMKKTQILLLIVSLLTIASFTFLLSGCSDDEGAEPSVFEPEIISSDIIEDTRLENINPEPGEADYIVTKYIDVEAVLTIDPGVVIMFEANAGFFVTEVNTANGAIVATGTAAEPITFTGVEKIKGYWRGIAVESADARNTFDHITLEYAGSDFLATYGTSIKLNGGLAIEGVTGFNGSLSLSNSNIKNCDGYGLIVEQGTLLKGFVNNTFENNTLAAVRLDADNAGNLDSESTFDGGNGFNGVEVNASGSPTHALTADATWPAFADGSPYRIEQSFVAEAQLTIMPGATIEFEANQTISFRQDLDIPLGIIKAIGTETEPITFTGAVKTPGYWQGLIIQSSSTSNEMDYCIVEYGGSDPIAGELANIGVDKDGAFDAPNLTITNSTIRHSAGCGIVVETGSSFSETGNTFSDNAGSDVCL